MKIFSAILKSRRSVQPTFEANAVEANVATGWKIVWMSLQQQGYLVPFFISLTYLIFIVLPLIVEGAYCFLKNNCHSVALDILHITLNVNTISDALIYIFGDKDIRNYLKDKFTRNTVEQLAVLS